jgi:predicted phosphodiesterase
MRIAYISDLHSNFFAVEALEKDLKSQGVDEIRCLGDILNFGSKPVETLQWVKENCSIVLRGENDSFIAGIEGFYLSNPMAIKAADWTFDFLTDEDFQYIENLPVDYEDDSVILTHDEPSVPGSMAFVSSVKSARDTMTCYSGKICFYGHVHIPLIFVKDKEGNVFLSQTDEYQLKEDEQYLICVGSVGQPKEKDPRLTYVIHDTEKNRVYVRRVEYPYRKAAEDIISQGLPEVFAKLLTKEFLY